MKLSQAEARSWRLNPGLSLWVAGTQLFETSLLLHRVCISRKLELGAELGLRLLHAGTGCKQPDHNKAQANTHKESLLTRQDL